MYIPRVTQESQLLKWLHFDNQQAPQHHGLMLYELISQLHVTQWIGQWLV